MLWLKKTSAKDAAACLALANLYFLHVWRFLLNPARQYFIQVPTRVDFFVLLATIPVVAVLMYGSLLIVRRMMIWAGDVMVTIYLFLLVALSVTAYHPEINDWIFGTLHPNRIRGAALLCCCFFAALSARKWPSLLPRAFRSVGLVLLPCFFLTTMKSADFLLVRPVLPGSVPANHAKANHKSQRTALIIFDMLDYETLFEHRPPDLLVPEFDRLKSESLFADKAITASAWTLTSLPTLTTGRIVTDAKPMSSDDLLLSFSDSPDKKGWKESPTVFSEARDAGLAVALVGWYHPYCRLFGSMLSSCVSLPIPDVFEHRYTTAVGSERAMTEVVTDDFFGLNPPFPIGQLLENELKEKYIDLNKNLTDAAIKALSDPALDFVFVHLPVPHPLFIYNRHNHQFVMKGSTYLDNVALADHVLGEMRCAMDRAGLWNRTDILLTSDHGFREQIPQPSARHVPFFLKLSQGHQAVEDKEVFNSVRVYDLLMALIQGRVASVEQARELLHPIVQAHSENSAATTRTNAFNGRS